MSGGLLEVGKTQWTMKIPTCPPTARRCSELPLAQSMAAVGSISMTSTTKRSPASISGQELGDVQSFLQTVGRAFLRNVLFYINAAPGPLRHSPQTSGQSFGSKSKPIGRASTGSFWQLMHCVPTWMGSVELSPSGHKSRLRFTNRHNCKDSASYVPPQVKKSQPRTQFWRTCAQPAGAGSAFPRGRPQDPR